MEQMRHNREKVSLSQLLERVELSEEVQDNPKKLINLIELISHHFTLPFLIVKEENGKTIELAKCENLKLVKGFVENKYKLPATDIIYLKEFEGKHFSELPAYLKRRIMQSVWEVVVTSEQMAEKISQV